jgi:hypothetical protein
MFNKVLRHGGILAWVSAMTMSSALFAANITWGPAFDIEVDTDIDVSNTIVRAVNVADPNSVEDIEVAISGVTLVFEPEHTFVDPGELQPGAGSVTGTSNFYTGQEQSLTTGNSDLDSVLDSHGWVSGNPTIAELRLQDLVVGNDYQIQLIGAADDRGCCDMRQMTVVDENENRISDRFGRQADWDDDGSPGPGSVIGTFKANSTEQLIFLKSVEIDDPPDNDLPGNDPGLSAYILSRVIGGIEGDYNSNGVIDAGDLDVMATGMMMGDLKFDLNGNGVVNVDDRVQWIKTIQKSWVGDSNFDGEFNSTDFVFVFTVGKYELNQPATYAEGDWNGDKVFNSSDFVLAFSDGGFERGPLPAVSAVPEPSAACLAIITVFGWNLIRRRRG